MQKLPKLVSLSLAAILFSVTGYAKDIIIYHTSDTHGHYFSRPDDNGTDFGGFARLESFLQKSEHPFILLDSGDFSNGSHEANSSKGAYSIYLMNNAGKTDKNFKKAGYAALTIGNHDTDAGDRGLKSILSSFKGDVLASNITGLNIPNHPVKKSAIYDVDGVKIGVIGVAMNGVGSERIQITAPREEVLLTEIQNLKDNQADVLVILAHDSMLETGVSEDKQTILLPQLKNYESFADVDLLLGGHAHKQFIKSADETTGATPWVIESRSYVEGVTQIPVHKDDNTGKITIGTPKYITLYTPEDPQVKKYLDVIRKTSLDKTVYAFVPKRIPKYPETSEDRAPARARMMAQEMYAQIKPQESKLDLAAYSLNSTRSDLSAGQLTGRALADLTPYNEHSGTFDITGLHLKRAVAESIQYDKEYGCFSVYGYSDNVRISFTCGANGENIRLEKMTIDGKEVKNSKVYRMAMLTHLPRGFYEGKPFEVLPQSMADDGTVIKHYRDLTSSALLFDIVKKLPLENGTALFVPPTDVQITQLDRHPEKEPAAETTKTAKK